MRSAVRVLVAFGGLLVLAGAWPVAGASPAPTLQVSVNGAPFTARPSAGAFAVDGLAPGGATSVVVGVRSRTPAAPLSVRLLAPHDDGGLGRALVFSLAVSADPQATYREVWSGSAVALTAGVATGVDVGRGADRWIRLTARVPGSAGNEIAGAAFSFGLRIQVSGSGVDGVSIGGGSVGGGSTPSGGAEQGHGTDAVSITGVPVLLLLALAAALGAAGGLVLRLSGPRRPR